MIRSLKLPVLPHPLGKGQGLERESVINQTLCDEASMKRKKKKIPKLQDSKSSQVGEHIHMLGGWHITTPWGQKLPCSGSFQTLPYVLPHPAAAFVLSFTINW